MCGTFGQPKDFIDRLKSKELLKSRRLLISGEGTPWKPVIKPNQTAGVLTHTGLIEAQFGFVLGEFKDGRNKFWFNARVEYFENKGNSANYDGPFEIFNNREIAPLLKHQRAIIPMSHFFENPEGNNNQKFLIKPTSTDLLYVGGVWSTFINEDTGEESKPHFCILTTAANKATKAVNHHRSPLLIEEADINAFLNPEASKQALSSFFKPNDKSSYECFEISKGQLETNNLFEPKDLNDFEPIADVIKV